MKEQCTFQTQKLPKLVHRTYGPRPGLLHAHNFDQSHHSWCPTATKGSSWVFGRLMEDSGEVIIGEFAVRVTLEAGWMESQSMSMMMDYIIPCESPLAGFLSDRRIDIVLKAGQVFHGKLP